MSRVPAVILAGGLARRMGGGDKCLLQLGDRRLLSHVIERITPQVGGIAINANGDPGRFSEFALPVLPDLVGGFVGPLGGILTAMEWAGEQGAKHVITVASDTPFFPRDLVERLQSVCTDASPIAMAASLDPVRGALRQPTFGLWPVGLRHDLAKALQDGVRKVVQWTDRHGTALAGFDISQGDPFFNINTAADLELAQQSVGKGQS